MGSAKASQPLWRALRPCQILFQLTRPSWRPVCGVSLESSQKLRRGPRGQGCCELSWAASDLHLLLESHFWRHQPKNEGDCLPSNSTAFETPSLLLGERRGSCLAPILLRVSSSSPL